MLKYVFLYRNMNFTSYVGLLDKFFRLSKYRPKYLNFHSFTKLSLETFRPILISDVKCHYYSLQKAERKFELTCSFYRNNLFPNVFCLFYSTSSYRPKWNVINPLKLYDVWYQLERLKHEWDPSFDTDEFKFGVKQAFCTIASLIGESSWNELRGLLTLPLLNQLPQDENLLNIIKKIGNVSTNDIASTQIIRVTLQEIVDQKYCDIDVGFKITPSKLLEKDSSEKDESTKFIFRFHREYTREMLPQWTITKILVNQL